MTSSYRVKSVVDLTKSVSPPQFPVFLGSRSLRTWTRSRLWTVCSSVRIRLLSCRTWTGSTTWRSSASRYVLTPALTITRLPVHVCHVPTSDFSFSSSSSSSCTQSNRITKLEGLQNLGNLKELYLSHNGIEVIEGLENNVGPKPCSSVNVAMLSALFRYYLLSNL